MNAPIVTPESVLATLSQRRIVEVGRRLNVPIPSSANKERQIARLTGSLRFDFGAMLRVMEREELRAACEALGLDASGRARIDLTQRLLGASAFRLTAPASEAIEEGRDPFVPEAGDIVGVRQRQYLVEEVRKGAEGPNRRPMTLVVLSCLDDDAPGRRLEVLWELELGARVRMAKAEGLGKIARLDSPAHFVAYLSALRWSCVTATRGDLFQAPFRAGIQIWNHQLVPLQKALALPRANLFIADDVGLGKTIEAGLVMQELQLRQRVAFVLIVCPASVVLQWRDEMEQRFGLHFEVVDRQFVARRQQERGFGVNPWGTHARFIISYPLLRKPAYRDPLLQHLGERVKKSMLVLDEAHTVAPASAGRYAVDSQLTGVVRDVAPRFENRLFLSATPHNGHSNSFSALLELLDPQRFTRGVRIDGPEALEAVMVRRLKSQLRALPGKLTFPKRRLIEVVLSWQDDAWTARTREADALGPPTEVLAGRAVELELASMLAEYTALRAPGRGRARLVFINLQKRLLSSVEAFHRTLVAHAGHTADFDDDDTPDDQADLLDEDTYGPRDDTRDADDAWAAAEATRTLQSPSERARALLDAMLTLSAARRHARDAKVAALLAWIRQHQCPGAGLPDDGRAPADRAWTDRRVILFTEYGDTRRYLLHQLRGALAGTELAEDRVMSFHGGMGDERRAEVQAAFNAPPDAHPVRILVATDAAREGVNLQGHCADLFHLDVPWNPARLEQRNGRIDRTLQPEAEVRCMYFIYPQRPEDRVLEVLVGKLERIRDELGSLGAVLMDRVAEVMEAGIDASTPERLELATRPDARQQKAATALDAKDVRALATTLHKAGAILRESRAFLDFRPALLREVVDVGLALAGAGPLEPFELALPGGRHTPAWRLPPMPEGWERTVDTVRPARRAGEPLWEWRQRPPLAVVFEPPERFTDPVVHLHLQHPFTQRILARFLAQGFAADDLSRVSVLTDPDASELTVLAFARLSLFGHGAVRLHDELLHLPARLDDSEALVPLDHDDATHLIARLPQLLRAPSPLSDFPDALQADLVGRASADFARLWPALEDEAAERGARARALLAQRANREADDLRAILAAQRLNLDRELQTDLFALFDNALTREELRQVEAEKGAMRARRDRIDDELRAEPDALRALYDVALQRLEPIALLYLWPSTR